MNLSARVGRGVVGLIALGLSAVMGTGSSGAQEITPSTDGAIRVQNMTGPPAAAVGDVITYTFERAPNSATDLQVDELLIGVPGAMALRSLSSPSGFTCVSLRCTGT